MSDQDSTNDEDDIDSDEMNLADRLKKKKVSPIKSKLLPKKGKGARFNISIRSPISSQSGKI